MSVTVQSRRIVNPVQRDAVTFLETAEESGGRRTLLEVELAPGGGNEPHRHLTYAERFVCQEGELTIRAAGLLHVLHPGDEATAQPRELHSFANETDDTVRFVVELMPGHRGFEQGLQIAYGLARDGLVNDKGIPKRLVDIALLVDLGESRLPGVMRLLNGPLRLLAHRARRRGVEAALVERYVRY